MLCLQAVCFLTACVIHYGTARSYDPDDDTPDNIAREIGDEFDLSSTDRDICAAALKEWLAKELPGDGG